MPTVDSLEAMLARGQDSPLLRFGLGQEYLKRNQNDRAITHLRAAVEKDPKYSAAWKMLGQALAAAGRNDDATSAYREGIRIAEEKGDIQSAREMGVFLKRLQR
jgi:Tfp pilus assembly protein PilF